MTNNKKVNKKDVAKLLSQWSQEFSVFVPWRDEGVAKWAKWDGKDTSFLDWYRNTVVPPKAIFLPQMEEMFSFQKDKEGYHIELPASDEHKQLIFGIRPCDAKALAILDMTFKDVYEDPYYLSRRNNTILIGLGCTNPYDTCFCTSLGSSPTDSTNVDLMLIDIGDQFLVGEVTDKGKELVANISLAEEATEADEARAKEAREAAYNKITRQLDTKDIDYDKIAYKKLYKLGHRNIISQPANEKYRNNIDLIDWNDKDNDNLVYEYIGNKLIVRVKDNK